MEGIKSDAIETEKAFQFNDEDLLKIHKSWHPFFKNKGVKKVLSEIRIPEPYYPKRKNIFKVFEFSFDTIKVVILGQDVYHGEGQAIGLSFAVKKGVKVPPSLRNIYKELETDIEGFKNPGHGDLTYWLKQGVFLLNCSLTVAPGKPGSHMKIWEPFTDMVINYISKKSDFVVFILWGAFAQKKQVLIDDKHAKLMSAHPSPLSSKNFFGNYQFSTTNRLLEEHGKEPIDWILE